MYWKDYKFCLNNYATHILSNPGPTQDAIKEWFKDDKFCGKFYEFSPPINTYMADKVVASEENEIVFVGRHLDFKCPDDVIKAVSRVDKNIRPKINFIGSHNDAVRQRMELCAEEYEVKIEFFAGINDAEKFKLIKQAKLMVIPSRFEGFGMPPAEAIYCGKPVIAYDLEITKWIYGDAIEFVEPGNLKALGKMISKYLKDDKLRSEKSSYALKQMWNKESNMNFIPSRIKDNYRKIFYGASYPKITAGVIVLNGMDTIKNSLDSIYDSVEKIILVEGAVVDYEQNNKHLVQGGHSNDGTLEYLINSYPDPDHKLEVVTIEDDFPNRKSKLWQNKNEMQNSIAKRINTEIYLKVDADEIWRESDIEYVRRLFIKKPEITVINMQRWHFWKNLETVAVGGQWDSAESRAWRWNKEFTHPIDMNGGFNYYVDKEGRKVSEPHYRVLRLMVRMHYHLGYCREFDHIVGKINYYKNRGIEQNVKDNFTNWQPGMPTNSTHPNGTGATKFTGTLPKVLDTVRFPKVLEVNANSNIENNIGMLPSPIKN
jgi:hypothetical protein